MRSASLMGRSVAVGLVAAVAALCAAGAAQAQTAYVAGTGTETLRSFDSETMQAGPPLELGAAPSAVAVSPDGRIAYVAGYSESEVIRVDTATHQVLGSIPVPVGVLGLALSPDGGTLYVSAPGGSAIATIDTATDDLVGEPVDINGVIGMAASPDGRTLYAAEYNDDQVAVINTATMEIEGAPIPVGDGPEGIAITPDGSTVYVAGYASGDLTAIDTASEEVVGAPIEVGPAASTVAVSPDGSRVYVAGGSSDVTTIDTATGEVIGEPITVGSGSLGGAVTADGRRLILAGIERGEAVDLDTGTLVGATADLGESSERMALTPAQTPVASFTAPAAAPGSPVAFDAGASHTFDGRIASYDWDFGDGHSAADAGPNPTHTFAAPGTYRVTLTVDNGENCPGFVFTGQTATCGGPSVASVTRDVTVAAPASSLLPGGANPPPRLRRVRVACPKTAKPGGCRLALQIVSAAPKQLKSGKLAKPRPESGVARIKLAPGKSGLVTLHPKPKYASAVARRSSVFVKLTSTIAGRSSTTYPQLRLLG